ncbi:MAG: radical SAM protein [Proteobacteria bacterium]|nr:radical SAM protein [Pseudomonadota bacterium]
MTNGKKPAGFLRHNRDLAGVMDGEFAFCGPELLQIDVTNSCNNNCIACWCRSPLLGNRVISGEVGSQQLPFALVKQTLDDCAKMGTTDIYLAGGGEPFMHPGIMDIVSHIKALGFRCHVNTNFTLVDKGKARDLKEMGVDNLIVSLWAATPQTYVDCHSNQNRDTFLEIIDTLKYLVELKENGGPHIKLYNVIMNRNYREIVAMAKLAEEVGVDAVEYTVADVIPGFTDELLLTAEQRSEVLEACAQLELFSQQGDFRAEVYYKEFMRRISGTGADSGEYDTVMLTDIPCFIGWNFSRVLADGNINACLKAHRIPVGNIHESSFREIWNSAKQREFRRKTREGNAGDPFFAGIGNAESSQIGCHRGCDDIERNRRLWRRLLNLSCSEKLLLKGAGYYYRLTQNGLRKNG